MLCAAPHIIPFAIAFDNFVAKAVNERDPHIELARKAPVPNDFRHDAGPPVSITTQIQEEFLGWLDRHSA